VPGPPGAAPIDEPSGDPIDPPCDPPSGCVVDIDGAGVLDTPPHAVGWSAGVSDPLDPEASAPAVTMSGWAPDDPLDDPDASAAAALADGGGTVRSLWQ